MINVSFLETAAYIFG